MTVGLWMVGWVWVGLGWCLLDSSFRQHLAQFAMLRLRVYRRGCVSLAIVIGSVLWSCGAHNV
jgi:hypothetical protein